MNSLTKTGYIVSGFVLLIFGVDVWLALDTDSVTISEWIWRYSSEYPIISFMFGVLAGHLFWAQRKR